MNIGNNPNNDTSRAYKLLDLAYQLKASNPALTLKQAFIQCETDLKAALVWLDSRYPSTDETLFKTQEQIDQEKSDTQKFNLALAAKYDELDGMVHRDEIQASDIPDLIEQFKVEYEP